jgi:hypothetical protein
MEISARIVSPDRTKSFYYNFDTTASTIYIKFYNNGIVEGFAHIVLDDQGALTLMAGKESDVLMNKVSLVELVAPQKETQNGDSQKDQ